MGNFFKSQENEIKIEEPSTPQSLKKIDELNEKISILEQRLLNKFAYPLDNSSLYFENIPISFNEENNIFLHTLICGLNELKENPNINKKIIIMLHGFQGNSLNFYKIIPYIYEKYICICPDIIGMGISSRVNIEFTSNEQCTNFFIDSLEAFRVSLEKIYNLKKKFILCGHSLGGYFAVNYAIKHPDKVESLFLMSPTGISDVEKYGGNIFENMSIPLSLSMRASSSLWKKQTTVQDYSQVFFIKNIINYSLRNRYDISKEENEILGEITELTLQYPKDLDNAIYFIFKHPFPTAVTPLEDKIKEKIPDMKVIFCYGETDWMDNSGAKRLNYFDKKKYKYFTIYNAGHTHPLDNPGENAKILIHEI